MPRLIPIDSLRLGDVLLCYRDPKLDPTNTLIKNATNSDYTHAAICVKDQVAAEAVVSGGVIKTCVSDLLRRYDHLAAFRQPDAWNSGDRIEALVKFVDSAIAAQAKYNFRDIVSFRKRRDVHELSLTQQLDAFFRGELVPPPVEKGRYFCSELVADCFVAVGFLDPSVAIVYKSNVTSPGALGRDPTFGTFLGYLSATANYAVPSSDEFFNATTYDDIFGAHQ